jgi:hypothetical protein
MSFNTDTSSRHGSQGNYSWAVTVWLPVFQSPHFVIAAVLSVAWEKSLMSRFDVMEDLYKVLLILKHKSGRLCQLFTPERHFEKKRGRLVGHGSKSQKGGMVQKLPAPVSEITLS